MATNQVLRAMNILERIKFLPRKDIPIQVFPHMVQWDCPQHGHEFSEFAVVTSGRGLHITGKNKWRITRGDAYVIEGDRSHEIHETNDLELMIVVYDPSILVSVPPKMRALTGFDRLFGPEPSPADEHPFTKRLRLQAHELPRIKELIYRLHDNVSSAPASGSNRAVDFFFKIVELLALSMTRLTESDLPSAESIEKARTYIDQYLRDPLTLQHIADVAGMSKRNLTRRFRALTGRSPIDYLLYRRVRQATELLSKKHLTISEVAFLSGFSDSNYFTRQFGKLQGLSPSQYRKKVNPRPATPTSPISAPPPIGRARTKQVRAIRRPGPAA
jgi:AraC-like DNA-binding protein/mannose-6-phosphate isomerase-like protein (cupin superfamily)